MTVRDVNNELIRLRLSLIVVRNGERYGSPQWLLYDRALHSMLDAMEFLTELEGAARTDAGGSGSN